MSRSASSSDAINPARSASLKAFKPNRRANNRDSANSQFFIMFAPHPELDNNYTVIGRVVSGMDAVDGIAPGEPPQQPTKIVRAYLGG